MQQNNPVLEIDASGNKFWYLNGGLHREDGPAVEKANGTKAWYLNGDEYTFDKWLDLTPLSDQEKVKLRFKYAN